MARKHKLPPSASALSASMRDLGHSLETALAEMAIYRPANVHLWTHKRTFIARTHPSSAPLETETVLRPSLPPEKPLAPRQWKPLQIAHFPPAPTAAIIPTIPHAPPDPELVAGHLLPSKTICQYIIDSGKSGL